MVIFEFGGLCLDIGFKEGEELFELEGICFNVYKVLVVFIDKKLIGDD